MTVKVRFLCRELVGDMENGEYDFPEGVRIGEALQSLAEKGSFRENYENYMLFMVNSRPAQAATVLNDGDSLMVLRKVMGG